MDKIKVHWCNIKNFGDALNPYVFSKLSGLKVQYCNYTKPDYIKEIKLLIKAIIKGHKYDYNRLKNPISNGKVILGIGSLLDRSLSNFQVWGSGYMNEFERAKGGTLYAVRGKYSAKKLFAEGFPFCEVWGDPALLLPLIYKPQAPQNNVKLGIVPHSKEYQYFKKKYPIVAVINLSTNDIENVINEICACQYILSSTLHGIIVAQAYGIPAIWIKKADINTDGIKFKDYLDSVGIKIYDGFKNIEYAIDKTEEFFEENMRFATIQKSISLIQISLLKAAPFSLLKKYVEICEQQ